MRVTVSMAWVVDELADGDAHRTGDSEDARDARVVSGALDTGDRLIVQTGARRHVQQRQPERLAPSLDTLHTQTLTA
jgi:hypothetical protein